MPIPPPPSVPPLPLRSLRRINYEINDRVYKNETINLDGYTFINCAFMNCFLNTTTGNFRIRECFFGSQSLFVFNGVAQRIVKLASLLDWNNSALELRATFHSDGSVTVE